MDDPMQFIEEWNQNNAQIPKICLRPEPYGDNLYGVEFRFYGQSFSINDDIFAKLCNRVFTSSRGLMQVTTDIGDFRSGILYIAVLFCNHSYTPRRICKTLNLLMDEVFPDLAK